MAMGQMGAMQAKLGLDLSQFQSGARAASAEAQKMAGNINQAWAGVRNSVEVKAARSFGLLQSIFKPSGAWRLKTDRSLLRSVLPQSFTARAAVCGRKRYGKKSAARKRRLTTPASKKPSRV
ncbi:hypothetical protein RPE78_00795 [Thioclava litoralis]|uniref:Uncharacterized protein n=1 Tax=Thioclava litoralis TaxID=3076557 RepID=A0ABZ1DZN2_9RHOB|nr:hypothetical protein RPE78_00795 [Thioclava sp. FTW29]